MKNSKVLLAGLASLLIAAVPALAANSITVTGAAAIQGSFGMSVNLDPVAGAYDPVYVQDNSPNGETHMVTEFKIRAQALDAPASGAGRNFRFFNWGDDQNPATPHKILFAQRQATTGNWRFLAWTYDNGAYTYVGGFFLFPYHSALSRTIRCEWTQATAGANGSFRCERTDSPGTQFFERTNIDDTATNTDYVQVGLFDYDSFNGPGSFHFDDYVSTR